jgi:hypothetical protein
MWGTVDRAGGASGHRGCSWRIAAKRVGGEHAGTDRADRDQPDQHRCPDPAVVASQRRWQPHGEREQQHAGGEEVGNLYPAELPDR